MSVHPSGQENHGILKHDMEDWKGTLRKTVFEAADERLNSLHRGDDNENRRMRGRGVTFEEQMSENTPFLENTTVNYDISVSHNVDEDYEEELLEDELGELDINHNEGGEFYQVNIDETVDLYQDGRRETISSENVKNSDAETDFLGVHAVLYDDGKGNDYLVHWDPKKYDGETGEKVKFQKENGSPDLETPVDCNSDEAFESYRNMTRSEGMKHIHDELITSSEEMYRSATEQMNYNSPQEEDSLEYGDEVFEKAWKAERWRAMADTVLNFNESLEQGCGQSQEISF